MSTVNEREKLKRVYSSSTSWSSRVDQMPDNQVIAVFRRFQRDKKI